MKILVGMSGGVDSTTSAYLLKKSGYEVIGVCFDFVGGFDTTKAEVVAKKLNIPLMIKDYKTEFREKVINYFVSSYKNGITPNPCVYCNANMKFEKLLEVMKEIKADKIATGHYANVKNNRKNKNNRDGVYYCNKRDTVSHRQDPFDSYERAMRFPNRVGELCESPIVRATCISPFPNGRDIRVTKNNNDVDCQANYLSSQFHIGESHESEFRYYISRSNNVQKDQSYFLYRLTQEQLSKVIFPIGNMQKDDVRNFAKEVGLEVAGDKDSQDVCFVKDKYGNEIDYKEYIKRYDFGEDYAEKIARGLLNKSEIFSKSYFKKGEFVDKDGKTLGYHDGIINYTIGQRKGLNIAFGERKFVIDVDKENNKVILGNNDDLLNDKFIINDIVFQKWDEKILFNAINEKRKAFCKVRYRHELTECEIEINEYDLTLVLKCKLLNKARAITKGQSAVFYDKFGDILFGGIIE